MSVPEKTDYMTDEDRKSYDVFIDQLLKNLDEIYQHSVIPKNCTGNTELELRVQRAFTVGQIKHHMRRNIFYIRDKDRATDLLHIEYLYELKKYDEVISRLKDMPLSEKNKVAHYFLALSLHMSDKDLDEAVRRYGRALPSSNYFCTPLV